MSTDLFKIKKGIKLKPNSTTLDAEGEIKYNGSGNLILRDGSAEKTVLDEDNSVAVTNKTIVVASNTITTASNGNLSATELNTALAELQTDIDTRALASGLSDHLADTADAHDASAISSVAAGNLAATNVQTALDELQSDIDTRATSTALSDHINDATAAHAASAIANTPSGNLAATTVQAALDELQTDIDGRVATSSLPLNIASGGTGQTSQTAAFDALAPTTTKGDIVVSNGTDNIRLAAGTNGYILTADSAETAGIKWAPAGSTTVTSITSANSPYSLATSTNVLLVSASGGAVTVNLPTAVGISGTQFIIKATDVTNTITLDPNSTETIDGETTIILNGRNTAIMIVSDGSNWTTTKPLNRIQTKTLSADVTSDLTISDLTFSNLTTGRWYEATGQFTFVLDTTVSDTQVYVDVYHNSVNVDRVRVALAEATDTGQDVFVMHFAYKFKAANTTLTFVSVSASANSFIDGNGTTTSSYVQLEERNDLRETSAW